jgi:hypothetical protein
VKCKKKGTKISGCFKSLYRNGSVVKLGNQIEEVILHQGSPEGSTERSLKMLELTLNLSLLPILTLSTGSGYSTTSHDCYGAHAGRGATAVNLFDNGHGYGTSYCYALEDLRLNLICRCYISHIILVYRSDMRQSSYNVCRQYSGDWVFERCVQMHGGLVRHFQV